MFPKVDSPGNGPGVMRRKKLHCGKSKTIHYTTFKNGSNIADRSKPAFPSYCLTHNRLHNITTKLSIKWMDITVSVDPELFQEPRYEVLD